MPNKNVYLITGASSDVGVALVNRLYTENDVFILQGAGDMDTLNKLAAGHSNIHCLDVDLSNLANTRNMLELIEKELPAPTHFVHLPALRVINTKFKNFDFDRHVADLNIQLNSAILICQAVMPQMAKAKFGRVLFMLTSYITSVPPKNVAAYMVAKTGLAGLARSLSIDFAKDGVTVNSVLPSMIETKFLQDTSDLIIEASAKANPMGRNATVDDVVPAMAFLLSDEARFITGVELPITGGSAF